MLLFGFAVRLHPRIPSVLARAAVSNESCRARQKSQHRSREHEYSAGRFLTIKRQHVFNRLGRVKPVGAGAKIAPLPRRRVAPTWRTGSRRRLVPFPPLGSLPSPPIPPRRDTRQSEAVPRLRRGRAGEQARAFFQNFGNPSRSLDPPKLN